MAQNNDHYPFILKCKPTFNFQSIEFEAKVEDREDLEFVLGMYDYLVKELARIAPEQNPAVKRPAKLEEPKKPKEELATERQKQIMTQYGIPWDGRTTKKQAYELIERSKEEDSRKYPFGW